MKRHLTLTLALVLACLPVWAGPAGDEISNLEAQVEENRVQISQLRAVIDTLTGIVANHSHDGGGDDGGAQPGPTPEPPDPVPPLPGPNPPIEGLFGGVPGLNQGREAQVQWDLVPWRMFAEDAQVGVLAFHASGVERVVFKANGNEVAVVDTPSMNERVGYPQYHFTFKPSDFQDGKVRLAVDVHAGGVVTSKAIDIFANHGGTVQQVVYELPADEYVWNSGALADIDSIATETWLIIRPAAGVPPEDVVISGEGTRVNQGRIALHDLTLTAPIKSRSGKAYIWLDGVEFFDPQGKSNNESAVKDFAEAYWTDCYVHDRKSGGMTDFIRNCVVEDIGEDVIKDWYFIANTEIARVFRPAGTNWHSDITGRPHLDGAVVFLNRIVDCDSNGSGVFAGGGGYHFKNVAVIGNHVNNPKAFFFGSRHDENLLDNWLTRGNTWIGRCGFRVDGRFKTATKGFFVQDDTFNGATTFNNWKGRATIHVGGLPVSDD